ncbi:MAG: SagB/ThcOx family dehydrogenase [Bacteroidales bacterium]|jgi:SagB-type dehydrogenase family enzyme|nr:SagB/ThcOx family dehydrogenase [Bacteroidales bacterium]
MKKIAFLLFATLFTIPVIAQDKMIELPKPEITGGMPIMDALNNRSSQREFSDKDLSMQEISNVLWAAWGINRKSGKHTAPSSRNKQEMDVYISIKKGVFLYIPEKNALQLIMDKDIRKETGGQDFVGKAPLNLIFVANYKKAESTSEEYKCTSGVNAGFMSQNVYLYCASKKLASVVRGWFDAEKLHKMLGLEDYQEVILCHTVGFPTK